jgi:hypothetical protein
MNATDGAWLSLFLVALLGSLLFLRIKFPNASRTSETGVLLTLTVLFFSICSCFLSPHKPGASTTPPSEQAEQTVLVR